jgi:hypothetical protein
MKIEIAMGRNDIKRKRRMKFSAGCFKNLIVIGNWFKVFLTKLGKLGGRQESEGKDFSTIKISSR